MWSHTDRQTEGHKNDQREIIKPPSVVWQDIKSDEQFSPVGRTTFLLQDSGYKFNHFYFLLCRDDDEFRFNDASTHKGHLHQNGVLTRFCNETVIMISHICIKCKTRTN